MEQYEQAYLDLLKDILANGEQTDDRTGVGTYKVFGRQIRYKANNPFPLLTSKKIYWPGVAHELLWFIKGDTNIKYLQDNKVHIWDEWADENGDLGPVYGHQWRKWKHVDERDNGLKGANKLVHISVKVHDQLQGAIDRLKSNPECRRNIVSAWNVGELDQMALHPCHSFFQFNVRKDKFVPFLDLQIYQRSADTLLGVPFNMASYALLNCMVAQCVGMNPGEVIHTFGDVHIYKNHMEQVEEQLARPTHKGPHLSLNLKKTNIDDFVYDDLQIIDYKSEGPIKAPIAV